MEKLKRAIAGELAGWKPIEIAWLGVATAVILGLSLYWRDNWISLVAGLTGVWCVILTGKGKRSSFLIGLINTTLYAWIAFQAKYYGEVMLNMLYYFPMGFVGWFAWKKHMNEETGEVVKARLPIEKNRALSDAIDRLNAYDLILFLEPDVAFVQDGDRSEVIHADREKYSNQIKELFRTHGRAFLTVRGSYQERYETAVRAVHELLGLEEA